MQAFVITPESILASSRDALEVVNTGKDYPNLLDLEWHDSPLGPLSFKDFTTDVAVIKKSALEAGHPERGLVALFDIHRHIEGNMPEVAKDRLLVANMKSPKSRPVVVLTDLIDDWRLLYMSGEEFHEETFESRDHAKKAIGDAIADAGQKEALERMLSPERSSV